uniref:Uncharacterized protein n=1 Tax=Meloidogyne hapla TaxID=6305 RepID=A0A1I8BWP4_MELHA
METATSSNNKNDFTSSSLCPMLLTTSRSISSHTPTPPLANSLEGFSNDFGSKKRRRKPEAKDIIRLTTETNNSPKDNKNIITEETTKEETTEKIENEEENGTTFTISEHLLEEERTSPINHSFVEQEKEQNEVNFKEKRCFGARVTRARRFIKLLNKKLEARKFFQILFFMFFSFSKDFRIFGFIFLKL